MRQRGGLGSDAKKEFCYLAVRQVEATTKAVATFSGKRGGLRIIYYWFVEPKKLLFLFVYPKNEQEDLTKDQIRLLKAVVQEEYHEKK